MSRPLRIEYENAYYHVMNRGQARQKIFPAEEYSQAFLATLAEAHERFGLQIHAYCLMSNHYHLLVKTPEGNLQRAMRHVGGVYTQRYNRLKKTDGPLFKGRYKAILVDSDSYLLQLSKYIHRNPVDAGTVRRLQDYPWSSYPSYIGKRAPEPWLYRQEVYGQLQGTRQLAKTYQAFVNDRHWDETITDFYQRERWGPILGDKIFIERIRSKWDAAAGEIAYVERQGLRPSIDEIVKAVCDYYGIAEKEVYTVRKGRGVTNRPRKLAMYLAQKIGGYRLNDIANAFGLRHYGGVSNAIYMIRQEMEEDTKFNRKVNTIINRFDP